ncbi:MAG: hypothetical protein EPN23_01590 [Verrucomicrobia bacterium]|nr:MAG: hypothetical protein EPN23_01590 [Verrucomicrobiota bacterium]
MSDFSPFFAAHAHRLQQADLYWPEPSLGSRNPAWAAAQFRALIVRLSSFRDVDRSTPHLFLADAVRRAVPNAFVDFAFFPPPRDRALLREHNVPLLTGIFSEHSAEDFDVVLISNAYTLELLNLPLLLLGSGIPVWAHERAGRWPPLILGGSNAMAAQAIVDANGRSFVDAIFFGEGEEQVVPLVQSMVDRVASNAIRHRLEVKPTHLAAMQNIPSLWLTGRWPEKPIEKAVVRQPTGAQLPVYPPSFNSPEAGTARLQIDYGCPAFCTFCFEGYDRKPYREVPAAELLAAARELKRASGAETLEVFSFNFNTHGELLALLPELNRLFARVNVMSQRVDLLAAEPNLLATELINGKRSYTLGIEGISARMRAGLHKSLTTADITTVLQRLLREKIRELKFFFLLTGDETAADFAEFGGFCRELQQLCRQSQSGLRVMFSFGLLIHMPFTPLRHARLRLDEKEWQPLIHAARGVVISAGFEFRLAMSWPEYAATQTLVMAPHGLAPALLELAQAGYRYDQTLSAEVECCLREWMQMHGLWTDAWLGEKPEKHPFAFNFVRSNVTARFLFQQYQASRQDRDDGYCLGEACLACGACSTPAERKLLTNHKIKTPAERDWLKKFAVLMETKTKLKPVYGRFWLAPELAGVTPEWLNAYVLRELLAIHPEQTENLLRVRESLFTTNENAERWPIFSGETIFALEAWDAKRLRTILEENNFLVGGSSSSRDARPVVPFTRELELPPTKPSSVGPTQKIRWLGEIFPNLGKTNTPVFQTLEIALHLPQEFFPDSENVFQRWLKTRRVAFSLRRTEHGLRLELDSKKKAFLAAANLEPHLFRLTVGPAFDLADFLRAFGEPGRARRASVVVQSIALRAG